MRLSEELHKMAQEPWVVAAGERRNVHELADEAEALETERDYFEQQYIGEHERSQRKLTTAVQDLKFQAGKTVDLRAKLAEAEEKSRNDYEQFVAAQRAFVEVSERLAEAEAYGKKMLRDSDNRGPGKWVPADWARAVITGVENALDSTTLCTCASCSDHWDKAGFPLEERDDISRFSWDEHGPKRCVSFEKYEREKAAFETVAGDLVVTYRELESLREKVRALADACKKEAGRLQTGERYHLHMGVRSKLLTLLDDNPEGQPEGVTEPSVEDYVENRRCRHCAGTGYLYGVECPYCNGGGGPCDFCTASSNHPHGQPEGEE